MIRNLQEIKEDQNIVRQELICKFKASGLSILSFSRILKMPYTSLRAFMVGDEIAYKNIFKIKKWLGQ